MVRSVGSRASRGRLGVGASVVGAGLMVLLLGGCATGNQFEQWHMTEPTVPSAATSADNVPAQAVRVVFFRESGSTSRAEQPINLYLNGQYQASLVGSTYTEQSLCPGSHRVAAHFNDVRQRYVTKTEGAPMVVGPQAMQYFRVSEDAAGTAVINAVDASAAQGVTSLRLLQSHTLPRVVRNGCHKG